MAIFVVGFGVIRLKFWHVRHPVYFEADTALVLEYIKNALQNGGTTVDTQIGYPQHANLSAFPIFDALSAGILKIIALFTSDPIVGANLLAYADHLLSGVVGYVCFRTLRIRRLASVACAVAFAYVEFALQAGRVFGHETLQVIAPLAIGATLALLPGARPMFALHRRGRIVVLISAGVVGLAQPYWVAFSLIMLAASAVACFTAARRREAALLAAGATMMCAVAALCLLWPRLWGEPGFVIRRSPFEQPLYGLRVINLLLPPRSELFPALNRLYTYYIKGSELLTEGLDAFVGWAGLIGMLFALVLLVRLPVRRDPRRAFAAAEIAAVLIVLLILFAQSYGLGALFNLLITPEIRAQNRVSPLIAFLAIFVFAAVVARLGGGRRVWRRASSVVVLLVVALGLYDETAGIDYAALQIAPGTVNRWEGSRAAARMLSDALPPGSKILQLPFMPFPESSHVAALGSYEELNVPLFTKGFHYSFGSPPFSPSLLLRSSATSAMIDAAAAGFDEVLFYRAGYPNGIDAIVEPLRDALGLQANIDTPDILGFTLTPLQDAVGPLDPADLKVSTNWEGHGFSTFERDPGFTFRWDDSDDAKASVVIDNASSRPVEMRFCGVVVPSSPGSYPVTIDAVGQITHPPIDPAGVPVNVTFDAPPGRSTLSVAMPVPRLVTPPADPRHIHFQVRFPSLSAVSIYDRAKKIRARAGLAPSRECS